MGIVEYLESTRSEYIENFRRFLRQPSVSAKGIGIDECARLLEDLMEEWGLDAEIMQTDGNPIVYAMVESKKSDRTLLVYSHYDVQPPEPLEEWISPPFEAKTVDGKIIARGAADAKGNIIAFLKAVESYLKTEGEPPVNVKFLFEGEEEIGSPNLPSFVETRRDMLKADGVVCWDGGLHPSGRPSISLGVKGMLYVELRCRGAKTDLHSSQAPIIVNPAWRIVWALNTIKSPDGRIEVEGWYDDVRPPTEEELKLLSEIPFEEEVLKRELGVEEFLGGVKGLEALKRLVYEPTANIAGISSGYTGAGSKTVLPCEAIAKIDFRLVVDQDPEKLLKLLRKHLDRRGFSDVELVKLGTLLPSRTPLSALIAKASMKASEKVYRAKPVVYPNSAGSGPDFVFTKILGLHSVWTGCSPPLARAHAPNEFNTIEHMVKGVLYAAEIMENFRSL
ncbi:M20/M25/M40 family metallo-hydrolase [Candidatus Bathyarchaeota archaeon]|nr:MAG: M20/M25/M40 family metallo-hydrolase [Candidatus Bathyarchaeota archaeon]